MCSKYISFFFLSFFLFFYQNKLARILALVDNSFESNRNCIILGKLEYCFSKSSKSGQRKQDHQRMNVAPNPSIILGLQIFLDHISLRSIDQNILMTSPLLGHLDNFFLSFCFFCLFVSISMLYWSKVPMDGAHVTDICVIS